MLPTLTRTSCYQRAFSRFPDRPAWESYCCTTSAWTLTATSVRIFHSIGRHGAKRASLLVGRILEADHHAKQPCMPFTTTAFDVSLLHRLATSSRKTASKTDYCQPLPAQPMSQSSQR